MQYERSLYIGVGRIVKVGCGISKCGLIGLGYCMWDLGYFWYDDDDVQRKGFVKIIGIDY